jgi:hypothetical protein
MHRDQAIPLVSRPTLAQHAAYRVAPSAKIVGLHVYAVREIDLPPLGVEHDWPSFFGRQPVRVRQRFDHAASGVWRYLRLVERHHPPNRQLPILGGGAPVRDARHPLFIIGHVTAAACFHDNGVGHRDAFVDGGRRAVFLSRR